MAEMIPKPGSISFEDRAKNAKPYEWGFGCTPRVAKLRDECYLKAVVIKDWTEVITGLGEITFRKDVKLDVDRARIVTNTFKKTEGSPPALRKAEVVASLCDEMPIFIRPGEIIVGDPNGAPNKVRWFPEICVSYIPNSLETGFKHMVTPAEKKEILEDIYEYWKDKTQEYKVLKNLPEDVMPFVERSIENPCFYANLWNTGRQLMDYDYESIYKGGVKARIAKAEAKLEELQANHAKIHPSVYLNKKHAWEGMIISGKALIRYAERHANLAREQAENEQDPIRKKELENMAAVCDWVPANTPRTFHEALQFFWFNEVVSRFLVVPGNGSGTRLDQVWWPYYEADMKAGRITRLEALELIECWMFKVQEVGSYGEDPQTFTLAAGGENFYTANIGGSKEDGTDACNDLTCLILEALTDTRLNQPPVMFRYHRDVNSDVVKRVIETIRSGTGHPAIFNENLLEKWALMRGYSLKDAKRTQAAGCVAMSCTGKPLSSGFMPAISVLGAPKMMEYALYQGKDAFS